MPRSVRDIKKRATKRAGRPRITGTGIIVGTRWHKPDLDAIDKFAKAQDQKTGRAEAIRALVRIGIAAWEGKKR